MNIISHTNSNLIDPNEPATFTPEDISQRRFGSKMVLVSEQMQILTIWTVKACLLLMYHRLTCVNTHRMRSPMTSKALMGLQIELEGQSHCQDCGWLCRRRLRRYGNPISRRVVQAT